MLETETAREQETKRERERVFFSGTAKLSSSTIHHRFGMRTSKQRWTINTHIAHSEAKQIEIRNDQFDGARQHDLFLSFFLGHLYTMQAFVCCTIYVCSQAIQFSQTTYKLNRIECSAAWFVHTHFFSEKINIVWANQWREQALKYTVHTQSVCAFSRTTVISFYCCSIHSLAYYACKSYYKVIDSGRFQAIFILLLLNVALLFTKWKYEM